MYISLKHEYVMYALKTFVQETLVNSNTNDLGRKFELYDVMGNIILNVSLKKEYLTICITTKIFFLNSILSCKHCFTYGILYFL